MGGRKVSKENTFPEEELHWKTAISQVRAGKILIRGYNLTDLIGRTTFSEMLWLVTMGELPSPEVARVMDAVLVSAVENGAQSPCVHGGAHRCLLRRADHDGHGGRRAFHLQVPRRRRGRDHAAVVRHPG